MNGNTGVGNQIFREYGIVLFLLLLFSSFLVLKKQKTIIFFGDSLTAGYGLSTEQAFPFIIEQELQNRGLDYKVVNAGLSGETSAGGLTRIEWILNQPVDIFVLELGANDGLRGLPLDQTKRNLQNIIKKVEKKYPEVEIVLAGMMVPPNMGKEYSDQFSNMYQELAKDNDTIFIPFLLEGVGGHSDLNLPDGIHPNVEGHKIVAKTVLRSLEDIL
jgi:acyl-CoA thioesterase-1